MKKFKLKKIACFLLIIGCLASLTNNKRVDAGTTTRYTGQDYTFYVSYSGDKTASGVLPTPNDTCAVHPVNYYVNGWNQPVFKFGTKIIPDKIIQDPYSGMSIYTLTVQDTGELNNQNNFSRYWFDVWIGSYTGSKTSSPIYQAAIAAGTFHNVSYYTYVP